MKYDSKIHKRKSIRLPCWNYSSEGAYFVTICTKDRECFFGDVFDGKMVLNINGKIVFEEWIKTKTIRQNVDLDKFVIMPNHVHGILLINCVIDAVETPRWGVRENERTRQRRVPTGKCNRFWKANSLGSIINQFKSIVTKRIRTKISNNFAWQPRFYEHIIRNDKDMARIQEYIINNPLEWKLDENNPKNIKKKGEHIGSPLHRITIFHPEISLPRSFR